MADEITELRERLEYYRHRSVSVPLRPIAAAYADAADELEEIIVRVGAAAKRGRKQPKGRSVTEIEPGAPG